MKATAVARGLNIAHHQHHADRLTQPLKRVDGQLQPISWDQALDEIAARLRDLVDCHGPRCLAYMGGGGQGCHLEAAFGLRVLRGLGSQYHYSPLAQELTGFYWAWGRATGKQYLYPLPDHDRADMLLAVGWNGWMSHQMPQARRVLADFSKHPDKLLVVIDPRRSETAARANMHLAIRPGSDALLYKAMLAIIIEEGWQDQNYLEAHTSGWQEVESWLRDVDPHEACRVCGLEYEQVRQLCRLLTTRKWCFHSDLGILMNRHSTLASYLEVLLLAVCGRVGQPGGNVFPGVIMPLGSHSDERNSRTWRTMATDFPAILGIFPPAVMPEEIMSGHEQRLRAVICSQSNPLRSYPDTSAYEKAFQNLDLLVVCEVALTETARLAHYVLPSRTAYESWDASFFAWNWPEIYFQMRRPVVEPVGEPKDNSWIMIQLAQRLGLVPPIPDSLRQAAKGPRLGFGMALMKFMAANPQAQAAAPFILALTLGEELGSPNLAAMWGLLMNAPKSFHADAARAGFTPGPLLGDEVFQAILDHPEGLWIGKSPEENNLACLRTPDGKLNLLVPEMRDWLAQIQPGQEEAALAPDPEYPLILNAGRHMDFNANSIMRDPEWNKGKRDCTVAMHPDDATRLGLKDGQAVRVSTQAGQESGELEVTDQTRPGLVLIPHGFGLIHQGQAHGINVNRLTPAANRDRLAATPLASLSAM